MDYIYDRKYLNLEGKIRKNKYVRLDERIEKTIAELKYTGNLGNVCALYHIYKKWTDCIILDSACNIIIVNTNLNFYLFLLGYTTR